MAEGYKDFIAGTVGGFSGKVLDYPLDTVKVLLQTQNSLTSKTSPTTSISSKADAQPDRNAYYDKRLADFKEWMRTNKDRIKEDYHQLQLLQKKYIEERYIVYGIRSKHVDSYHYIRV